MTLNTQQDDAFTGLGLTVTRFDQIINAMYEAAIDRARLGAALQHVRELFEANYVTLILRAVSEPHLAPMIVSGDILGEGDPDGEVRYLLYRDESTPYKTLAPNQVFTNNDLMTEEEWERSGYYLMHCQPFNVFHTLGANLLSQDGDILRFRISRPRNQPAFSDADKAMCELIMPHLRRAIYLYSLLDRSESLGGLYSQAIGRLSIATIVLDESGAVLELNPIASEILSSNDGLKLVGGRLEATYPSDNRELQRVLRSASGQLGAEDGRGAEAVSISRPSGQVSLGVVVEAIPSQELVEGKGRPSVVVYIRDAVGKSLASTSVAKQLFNLTPAETALAMELANGLSLEEAAEKLNIRRNTARAHLRSIFSKTGVRRQTELVRIMLNSVVALGKPQPNPRVVVSPLPLSSLGRRLARA